MQSQEATRPTTNIFSVALKSRLICRFVHSCPINRTVHTDQIRSKTGEDELFQYHALDARRIERRRGELEPVVSGSRMVMALWTLARLRR